MAEIEMLELLILTYLSLALGLFALALARPRHRRLKLLYGFRYQLVVFLTVWTAGEAAELLIASGDADVLGALHFSAMALFAGFLTLSVTRLIKGIHGSKFD
ncbi:MAG: hypothetical protein ACE5PO_00135 [Candidatus Bathyarchaeia archaeon]